jgi:hypothetical protein
MNISIVPLLADSVARFGTGFEEEPSEEPKKTSMMKKGLWHFRG